MRLSPGIYDFLEGLSGYIVIWIFLFTLFTTYRIIRQRMRGIEKSRHNSVIVELAALPITVLQSVCFFRAAAAGDVISALLFLWWGPGLILTVVYLIYHKSKKQKPNWYPARYVISWLCKLNYLAFMIVFFVLHKPGMMLVYSVWVINDQYGLAFLSLDSDRLRRTFDDYWFIRILYPIGLFTPVFYPQMRHRWFDLTYGCVLLVLWLAGIYYVHRKSRLLVLPDGSSLWRNMVYFAKPAPPVAAEKIPK